MPLGCYVYPADMVRIFTYQSQISMVGLDFHLRQSQKCLLGSHQAKYCVPLGTVNKVQCRQKMESNDHFS